MQINVSAPDAHDADSSSTGASAAQSATITDPIARLSHELFDLQESVSQLLKQQQSHFSQQSKEQEANEIRQGWLVQHAAMQHHTKRLEYTSAASRGDYNLLEHEIASHQQARRETGGRLYCPCFTAEDEMYPPWEIARLRRKGLLSEDGVDLGCRAASPTAMGVFSCPGGSCGGSSSAAGRAPGWQDGGIGDTDLTASRLIIHLSQSSRTAAERLSELRAELAHTQSAVNTLNDKVDTLIEKERNQQNDEDRATWEAEYRETTSAFRELLLRQNSLKDAIRRESSIG